MKENVELWSIKFKRLYLFVTKIEDDLLDNYHINIMFSNISNVTMSIDFLLLDESDFNTVRKLQKYFYDNFPYIIGIDFNDYYLTIRFTRNLHIDTIIDSYN